MNRTRPRSRRLLHTIVIVAVALTIQIGYAGGAGAAGAQMFDQTNVTFPIDEHGYAPYCVQDAAPFLHVTGTMHYTAQAIQDAKGTFHYTSTVNLQGATAVPAIRVGDDFIDLATGPTWVSTSAFSATMSTTWTPGSPVTLTQISRGVLVSQGAEPNLLSTFTVHLTINANGVPTAELSVGDSVCLG